MVELFKVVETHRNRVEEYTVKMTRDEMRAYLKQKREVYGYVRGVGGDRCYDCWAVLVNY